MVAHVNLTLAHIIFVSSRDCVHSFVFVYSRDRVHCGGMLWCCSSDHIHHHIYSVLCYGEETIKKGGSKRA